MPPLMKSRVARPLRQRGSMMVEVLVSVLLLSVSILGLVRVLANSIQDSGELEYRSVASTVADETIGRIWVSDLANLAALGGTETVVPQLPNGAQTITVAGNTVTVTVTWQAPGSIGPSNHQVAATMAVNP